MTAFFKGLFLGFSLVAINKISALICAGNQDILPVISIIFYFFTTTAFLVSKKLKDLFVCGCVGLSAMFVTEFYFLFLFSSFDFLECLIIYVYGLFASFGAVCVSIVLTVQKISLFGGRFMEINIENKLKIKLLLYFIVSAVSFTYLVLPENAGISVSIFTILQFVFLFFIIPEKKKLWVFLPISVFALNCFISANNIWRIPNLVLSVILYACMFTELNFKKDDKRFLSHILSNVFKPIHCFLLPFQFVCDHSKRKAYMLKKMLIALLISFPCVIFLLVLLSSADMVFFLHTENFFRHIANLFSFNTALKITFGILVGLYLFGIAFCSCLEKNTIDSEIVSRKRELLTINTLLLSILFVYTLFVIVQFKYLFAGSTLPEGLTFTTYARKGFFELLALTGVNLILILTAVHFVKHSESKWAFFTKALCQYLCAVTVILLISSFYRMLLYTWDDGLTRLRFFVMGFLIFEALGLLATFIYIAKPKFNITLVYFTVAIVYYMILNVIPADNIIAKNQIEKYLRNERNDIEYVFTLSADATPSIKELICKTNDTEIKEQAKRFIKNKTTSYVPERWQRYKLSNK